MIYRLHAWWCGVKGHRTGVGLGYVVTTTDGISTAYCSCTKVKRTVHNGGSGS